MDILQVNGILFMLCWSSYLNSNSNSFIYFNFPYEKTNFYLFLLNRLIFPADNGPRLGTTK
jgi:hypothetical protein